MRGKQKNAKEKETGKFLQGVILNNGAKYYQSRIMVISSIAALSAMQLSIV